MRIAPILALAAFASLCAGGLGAQAQSGPQAAGVAPSSESVLRIAPFGGEGLGPGEAEALQNLVTSYAIELRSFRVIDAEGQELALREAETAVQLGIPKDIAPLAADYILSGRSLPAGGLIIFTLELTQVSTAEKHSVVETAPTVNGLILASRRMTRSLLQSLPELGPGGEAPAAGALGAPPAPADLPPSQAAVKNPSLAMAAGTWRGDKGLDRVSLFPDGRGLAVLSSGATMKVRARIQGSSIAVAQDQASIPEFYRSPGLDLKSAREVAATARPWKWIFSISTDGNSLFGVKESVFVKVDAQGAVSVDNNYVREALWKRLYR